MWTGFSGKTLWDWLQLLIIPLILASATISFGWGQAHLADVQHQQDQQSANLQHDRDQANTLDQQRAAILQTYLDNMQDLLLNHNLLNVKSDNEVAVLARARMLTALQGLDPERKARLLIFLHAAQLIGYIEPNGQIHDRVIDLSNASLSGADLFKADLSGTDLSGAILDNANLISANFLHADLSNADLRSADLTGANLSRADLSGADLTVAKLPLANLSYANLSKAHLLYADLSGAYHLTQQQLDQVSTCEGARLPEGLTCHRNQ